MTTIQPQVVLPSYIFVELTSLTELNFLTNASTRIKFTCLAASPLYLAVGSSGGSVYLFSRYASKHRKSLSNVPLQVIPCKEGSVINIKISPNETKIAVASSRGFMFVVNISGNKPSTNVTNVLHTGSEILAICWTRDSSRVYAGDSLGRLSCTRTGKTYFKSPCEIVLQLDSKIVQIDCYQVYVVVSTLSRCYVHDFARLKTIQIGKKLRSGSYGSCFYPTNDVDEPILFAARPGGRLWEVNCNGSVYNTHQFTTVKAPVASVVDWNRSFSFTNDLQSCNLSFSELYMICDQFLLSINGSKATIMDPRSASVVLFTSFEEDVVRYAVCGNDVFILTKDASLRKLTLFPFVKAVEKLQYRQCYLQSAQLISVYLTENDSCPWKIEFLKDIFDHLEEQNDEFAQSFVKLMEKVETFKKDLTIKKQQVQVTKMSSGIHKVVKIMENSGYDDDFAFRAPTTTTTTNGHGDIFSPSSNSLKRRSRSTPMVNHLKNGFRFDKQEKYSPTKKESSSISAIVCRDDTDVCAPCVVEEMTKTMTSSRSEESLCSQFGLTSSSPTTTNGDEQKPKEKQAPKIITSSTFKNGGKHLLNSFVQQLNFLSVSPNNVTGSNGDSYSATLYLEDDDDDAITPVAETPDDHFFKDIGSPLFKDLSSTPNVVRRNPRTSRLSSKLNNEGEILLNGNAHKLMNADETTSKTESIDVQYFDTSYVSVIRTDTPPLDNVKTSICGRCRVHKSWLVFFRFSSVVRRLPIVFPDEVFNGAIPSTIDDWTMLVVLWRSLQKSKENKDDLKTTSLCSRCKTMFDAWRLDFSTGSKEYLPFLNEMLNNFTLPSNVVDRSKTDFCLGIERETLQRMFFQSQTNRQRSLNEPSTCSKDVITKPNDVSSTTAIDGRLACSMYYNPLYESFCETGGENGVCETFSWLTDISLDALACCARQTLDDDETFETFLSRNDWMNEFLTTNFFRFVQSHEYKTVLPNEIVSSLIRDLLNDDSYVFSTFGDDVNSKSLPFSFDLSNVCPCCTLSILSKVTEFESTVVVFRCGHVFHKVCLPKSSPGASKSDGSSFYCLICNPEGL